MESTQTSAARVPSGIYFRGAVWGAFAAAVLVGLIEGWPLPAAIGAAGVILQGARLCRWLARVSPPDEG